MCTVRKRRDPAIKRLRKMGTKNIIEVFVLFGLVVWYRDRPDTISIF